MAALLRSLVRGLARSLGWREPPRPEPEPEQLPELDPYVVSRVVAGQQRGDTFGPSAPFTVTLVGGADSYVGSSVSRSLGTVTTPPPPPRTLGQ